MKKIVLILVLFISSCGYQPIYINKNLKNLEFSKITLEGDKDVNRKIIGSISPKENTSDKSLNELLLKSSFKTEEILKNSKGQVESYRSSINVSWLIIKDKKIIKRKNFLEDFTYSNPENKFELIEYQDEVKDNIVNKIIEEIILYTNL
jgi:hypothetical protein